MRVWDLDDDEEDLPPRGAPRRELPERAWRLLLLGLTVLLLLAASRVDLRPQPGSYCTQRAAVRAALDPNHDAGRTRSCELVDVLLESDQRG